MKKYIVVILLMVLMITGCGNKKVKDSGLVIFYKSAPTYGTVEATENYSYVKLYNDKKLKSGVANTNVLEEKKLSEEEYNEIVDYAFSKEFTSLPKDISDNMVADGARSSITIYYSDGTSFTTGGANPNNEVYSKLVSLLNKY